MTDISFAVSLLFQAVPALEAYSRNRQAYLVGGAVRDMMMGRCPTDYDIVTSEDPQDLAAAISRDSGAFFFRLGKGRQAVWRGRLKDHTIDLVFMAGGAIESDLRLRDFTINAMAVHLGSRSLVDPTGGQADVAARTVRMVSEQSFPGDPLRLLRTYRFAATLNFGIAAGTESAVRAHSRLIRRPAGERIREELIRLLAAPGAFPYLRKMKASGLLFDVFPELCSAKGCTQNHHHCFDVLDHTLFACGHLESLLKGCATAADPAFQAAIGAVDDRRRPFLKLAMLLHDAGKPGTRTVDAAGAVHFFGHEETGAVLCRNISARLKLSNPDAGYLCGLIQNHLRPVLLYRAHQHQSLTRKGIVRFFRSLNERTPDLLLMALADARAKAKRPCDADPSFSGFIADLMRSYFQDYALQKKQAPLITGRDLITRFGLQPSPAFKPILEAVEEARLSQPFFGREEALALVRTWLSADPAGAGKLDASAPAGLP